MTDMLQELAQDLAPFADLGTDPPRIVEGAKQPFVIFTRLGEECRIEFQDGNLVEMLADTSSVKHASFKALLASDRYGALRAWASQQALLLKTELRDSVLIEQTGTINNDIEEIGLDRVDYLLSSQQPEGTTRVLLIDGPAGIGKTNFIVHLALRRSEMLLSRQAPLILHVESRGRQLSYVTDLIAFSLQRLRSSVTFDQVPVLVKHGLVTIAIDGFDELADPNGYSLAWAQVNELVINIRGEGSLILAGRETFIGRQRVLNDIRALREAVDPVDALTLTPPTPSKAKGWLEEQGLSEAELAKVEGLLERGSLALRPFFLKQLADPTLIQRLEETSSGNALHFLIEAMIAREATKFGGEVDANLTLEKRVQFVRAMMYETARDMADNQTVAISEQTLAWLVEVCVPQEVPQTTESLLKHRAQYLGFLTVDSRPRYLRFYHDKFYEYFVARVIVDAVSNDEVPKFLTRSIFGSGFLETFSSVVEAQLSQEEANRFQIRALKLLRESSPSDRARRNISSLILAVRHLGYEDESIELGDVAIDEARMVGSIAPTTLHGCIVSQLDARDADLSLVAFENTTVYTLIVSEDSLFPGDTVGPARLVVVHEGRETILADRDEISAWLLEHSLNPPEKDTRLLPSDMYEHPAVRLLDKAARMRQYWLRQGDDKFADRILSDDNWKSIERLLEKNELLRKEVRDASGTDATFYHIRYAQDILAEDRSNPNIVNFFRDLRSELTGAD
jgi:hypothetical protein